VGTRTLECTKRMMGLKLYAALAVHGTGVFSEHVAHCFDLGARFAELLRAEPDFELAVEPQCNIVCFRHVPKGTTDLDAVQERIRRKLVTSGEFYVVQTRLAGKLYLRSALMNSMTTEAELVRLIQACREAAKAS